MFITKVFLPNRIEHLYFYHHIYTPNSYRFGPPPPQKICSGIVAAGHQLQSCTAPRLSEPKLVLSARRRLSLVTGLYAGGVEHACTSGEREATGAVGDTVAAARLIKSAEDLATFARGKLFGL